MGFSNWLWGRVFSDKNIGYLIEKTKPLLQAEIDGYLKDSMIKLLEDEDIAYGIGLYTDALYQRVSKKFFGAIGGTQKGLNAQTGGATDLIGDLFPDGQFNLMGGLRLLLSGRLKGLGMDNRPKGLGVIPDRFKVT